jgi:hypothetical protein
MLNASIATIHRDFMSISGGRRYKCATAIARLLLTKIGFLHSIDLSVTEYIIEANNVKNLFPLFLSLIQRSLIQIETARLQALWSLSRELCNYDLFF